MKQTIKRTIITGVTASLLLSPAAVFAEDGTDSGNVSSGGQATSSPVSPTTGPQSGRVQHFEQQLKDQLQEMKQERQSALQDKRADLQEKLDNAKKKACENHVATINKLMTNMDNRRQNALDQITKISDAVQAFYTKKQLSVANYDDLVAKVSAAKSLAETATQAQQQIPSLDCSGDHPRADVADFKDKRSTSIDAVKAYRDAVKDLVKAVKAAAEAAQPSPSPSTTPEGGDQ